MLRSPQPSNEMQPANLHESHRTGALRHTAGRSQETFGRGMARQASWHYWTGPKRRRISSVGGSFGWNVGPISITFGFRHVARTPPETLLTHRNPRGKSRSKNAPCGASGDASMDRMVCDLISFKRMHHPGHDRMPLQVLRRRPTRMLHLHFDRGRQHSKTGWAFDTKGALRALHPFAGCVDRSRENEAALRASR